MYYHGVPHVTLHRTENGVEARDSVPPKGRRRSELIGLKIDRVGGMLGKTSALAIVYIDPRNGSQFLFVLFINHVVFKYQIHGSMNS